MPEVHAQINGLREAFSADTSRPFELKASFPFGSPSSQHIPSPLTDGAYHSRSANQGIVLESATQINYNIVQQPITPPVSTTDEIPKADSPVVQSLAMMAPHEHAAQPSVQQEGFQGQWNPTKIFE
jgi:hypothetical protein